MSTRQRIRSRVQNMSKRQAVIAGIAAALGLVIVGLIVGQTRTPAQPEAPPITQTNVQTVKAATIQELQQGLPLTRTALLTPHSESPIIARAGGRITRLDAKVGDSAVAGAVIGKLDGGNEPNPTAAQVRSVANIAVLFNLIEQQSLVSADNAIALAQQGLHAAQAGQVIGLDIQRASIDIASTSLDQALLSARSAKETDIDAVIDAADVGVEAAKLARDLAVNQAQLQNRGTTDAIATATLNVRTGELARDRARAELASQRAQLQGQLAVAQEQLRLQEITTASAGTITLLDASVGDFVSPNQQIGAVVASGSARLAFEVPRVIALSIAPGQAVPVFAAGVDLFARVESISDVSADAGLFRVLLVIDSGVPVNAYGTQATAHFIAGTNGSTYLVPLDAIALRSEGPVIFSVSSSSNAIAHAATIIGYHGEYVEISAAITPLDRIIITNTRLLQNGSAVMVE